MDDRSRSLARNNIALLTSGRRAASRSGLARDRTLQRLVGDLIAARTAIGMTQEDVAVRMATTKSAVSRLESGTGTRPTLRTIERYAFAVGAKLEIRVRPAR